MAEAPVAVLDLDDKDHTLGKADQRSGRSLGPSDFMDLSYQLYLQCYLAIVSFSYYKKLNLIPTDAYASWRRQQ